MAKALVCDRCGKVYSLPVKYPDLQVFQSRSPHMQNEFFDLCDSCTKELREFMHLPPSNQES